jgi:hypothetical protein
VPFWHYIGWVSIGITSRPFQKNRRGQKRAIVALVGAGRGGPFIPRCSRQHRERADFSLQSVVRNRLHPDESRLYLKIGSHVVAETVKHSAGEYVRGDVHTTIVENVFSAFQTRHEGHIVSNRFTYRIEQLLKATSRMASPKPA